MKKSVLQAIREKASAVRGEIETSNAYSAQRMGKEMVANMKLEKATAHVWEKKRDQAQIVCGLKPDENGCYDYDKIDMTNPIVELEYFLCSPRNRAQTSQHLPRQKREDYLNRHLSKDAVELFWDPSLGSKWDKSGTPWNTDGMVPYYELEFRFGEVRKAMGLGGIRSRQAQAADEEQAAEIAEDAEQDTEQDQEQEEDKNE